MCDAQDANDDPDMSPKSVRFTTTRVQLRSNNTQKWKENATVFTTSFQVKTPGHLCKMRSSVSMNFLHQRMSMTLIAREVSPPATDRLAEVVAVGWRALDNSTVVGAEGELQLHVVEMLHEAAIERFLRDVIRHEGVSGVKIKVWNIPAQLPPVILGIPVVVRNTATKTPHGVNLLISRARRVDETRLHEFADTLEHELDVTMPDVQVTVHFGVAP